MNCSKPQYSLSRPTSTICSRRARNVSGTCERCMTSNDSATSIERGSLSKARQTMAGTEAPRAVEKAVCIAYTLARARSERRCIHDWDGYLDNAGCLQRPSGERCDTVCRAHAEGVFQ